MYISAFADNKVPTCSAPCVPEASQSEKDRRQTHLVTSSPQQVCPNVSPVTASPCLWVHSRTLPRSTLFLPLVSPQPASPTQTDLDPTPQDHLSNTATQLSLQPAYRLEIENQYRLEIQNHQHTNMRL
ncbi:hypothetical protein L1887_42050 [Cichorium endivia]|nr:hypothetical protein L1887_42050 [Cichorium endivia]